jgi:O-antigen ligase
MTGLKTLSQRSLVIGATAGVGVLAAVEPRLALGALLALALSPIIYTYPQLVPAVLLAAPPFLHTALRAAGLGGTRTDVLVDPITFLPVLALMFGLPLLRVVLDGQVTPGDFLRRGTMVRQLLLWMLTLEAVLAVRTFNTLGPTYGLTKTVGFFAFSIAPVVLIFAVIRTVRDVEKFLSLTQLLGAAYLIQQLFSGINAGQLNFYAGNSIGGQALEQASSVPRASAGLLLISLAMYLRRAGNRVRALVGAALGAAGLLLSGQRGTILGVLAGAFAILLANIFFDNQFGQRRRRRGMAAIGALAIGLVVAYSVAPGDLRDRYRDPFHSMSYEGRVTAQQLAWRGFDANPVFGQGTGASAVLIAGSDQQHFGIIRGLYPHNVIIELASELGLVGLVPYLAGIGTLLWGAIRRRRAGRWSVVAGLGLVVHAFVYSQGGADLTIANDLWMFAALLAIACDAPDLSTDPESGHPLDADVVLVGG